MSKGCKYDIPVLMDPRLQRMEYHKPLDIVLYIENDKPYTVKDLIEDKKKLEKKVIELENSFSNNLNTLKNEHNKLVRGYKKQITALKVQIATLGGNK